MERELQNFTIRVFLNDRSLASTPCTLFWMSYGFDVLIPSGNICGVWIVISHLTELWALTRVDESMSILGFISQVISNLCFFEGRSILSVFLALWFDINIKTSYARAIEHVSAIRVLNVTHLLNYGHSYADRWTYYFTPLISALHYYLTPPS